MRIASCAAPGADTSTSAATRPTREASVPGLIMRLFLPSSFSPRAHERTDDASAVCRCAGGPTVGDLAPPVNVQDCGMSVGDCGLLWQARGVRARRGQAQVPVVPGEAGGSLEDGAVSAADARPDGRDGGGGGGSRAV